MAYIFWTRPHHMQCLYIDVPLCTTYICKILSIMCSTLHRASLHYTTQCHISVPVTIIRLLYCTAPCCTMLCFAMVKLIPYHTRRPTPTPILSILLRLLLTLKSIPTALPMQYYLGGTKVWHVCVQVRNTLPPENPNNDFPRIRILTPFYI